MNQQLSSTLTMRGNTTILATNNSCRDAMFLNQIDLEPHLIAQEIST
ncbi:Protein of unknown function [Pyronema omphalodes CBS 100304]|uniref:Uncharacterized protein n=1 Tax=Pyronema omphalodes (strain CBS 100304) TaxID=1076935 RepID=U4L9E8_PYROM|nr:Protein of unknown function [Pyronema omphalodes CBS 100304]